MIEMKTLQLTLTIITCIHNLIKDVFYRVTKTREMNVGGIFREDILQFGTHKFKKKKVG